MTEEAPGVTAAAGPTTRLAYGGMPGAVAGIVVINSLLNLLTLGVYRFWGKTRLRRYLWRNISFQGDPFEYTGLPKELLIGFLIVLVVLIPLAVVVGFLDQAALAWGWFAQSAIQLSYSVVLLFLFQFAYFRARRYRLTRTNWRGIRCGLTGSAAKYGLISLGQYVLLALSFGLTLPLMNTTLRRFSVNNTWIGDRRFAFDGKAGALFGRWFLTWLLLIPTLGLSFFWYKAAELRYFTKSTTYENLRLGLSVTGGRLFGIYLGYVLALLVVGMVVFGCVAVILGIAAVSLDLRADTLQNSPLLPLAPLFLIILFYIPFSVLGTVMITHRLAGLLTTNLVVTGEQDFAAIAQSSRSIPGRGEGLADALDVGGL